MEQAAATMACQTALPSQMIGSNICRLCWHPGADIRLLNCGCEIHARCVPLNLIVSESGLRTSESVPVAPNSLLCPSCHSSPVSKLQIMPLSIADLERAVELRKAMLRMKAEKAASDSNSEREREMREAQAESSFLLLSHNHMTTSVPGDHESQRTGRWTDEEIAYVDFLVDAFDNGRIPVEHGLKLNEFLSDILLCKSSRLTKKMKNARLSVRSYAFKSPVPRLDTQMMSTLEAKFVESITSEPARLELKFNLARIWRTRLSNLCLQIGSSLLDAADWLASLEEAERRAAEAEERIRRARRRRMGMALKTEVRNSASGVFFAGLSVQRPAKKLKNDSFAPAIPSQLPSMSQTLKPSPTANPSSSDLEPVPLLAISNGPRVDRAASATEVSAQSSERSTAGSEDDGSEEEFINNMLDIGTQMGSSDDYAQILDDLAQEPLKGLPLTRKNCGPFVEAIVNYMETSNLSFQHVDVWVPSYRTPGSSSPEELRLFNAGFATRHDIDSTLIFSLDEYGDYSTKFSFRAGTGLIGRVFSSGTPLWERNVCSSDTNHFARAGGAKVYGIKTAVGMALKTNVIGLIVVAFYSVEDLAPDMVQTLKWVSDLSKFCPEPRWKLVVEMGPNSTSSESRRPSSTSIPVAAAGQPSGNQPPDNQEQEIAGLLGEYMPLSDIPAPGQQTSSLVAPSLLAPHFMSLRLLLLRSAERRSTQENEWIEIVKKSYQGYARDSRRSKREVAMLVVRDWEFLKSSDSGGVAFSGTSSSPPTHHKSHVLNAPVMSTFSNKGAPVAMPQALPYVDPTSVRRPSFQKKLSIPASNVQPGAPVQKPPSFVQSS